MRQEEKEGERDREFLEKGEKAIWREREMKREGQGERETSKLGKWLIGFQ